MQFPGETTNANISKPTQINGGVTTNGLQPSLTDSTVATKIQDNGTVKLAELDASLLTRQFTRSPRSVPQDGSPELWSFSACTDHMVTVKWTVQNGWEAPELKPYGDLSISPAASCLHYATQCFEGMKAYRG